MNGHAAVERLLATNPLDAGCDGTFAVLDVFAEEVIERGDPAARHPGVALHLASCPACSQDLQGILAAAECTPPGPG